MLYSDSNSTCNKTKEICVLLRLLVLLGFQRRIPRSRTLPCMYKGLWMRLYKQRVEVIGINQADTTVSSKTCKEQLGALKRIMLDNSIALDSCID
jgi:hypothetical protein